MQSLIMPFENDSADYAYGFECGILWQQMSGAQPRISQMIHRINYRQVDLMASVHHYAIVYVGCQDDGWVQVELRLKRWERMKAEIARLLASTKGRRPYTEK